MSSSAVHETDCCGDCSNCIKCSDKGEHAPGVPISLARVGERGTVVRISGRDETKRFLAGLGFTTGSQVSVVSHANGSVILEMKGSRIAIDRHMASKILFHPEG
ncbi:MAG: ferrous iron transport protein A [Candidatus Methanomethylophilaceae archaeon]|nr:ferrous iron transport protein A [Candidatus Methanomethylophilaceae archaeon]